MRVCACAAVVVHSLRTVFAARLAHVLLQQRDEPSPPTLPGVVDDGRAGGATPARPLPHTAHLFTLASLDIVHVVHVHCAPSATADAAAAGVGFASLHTVQWDDDAELEKVHFGHDHSVEVSNDERLRHGCQETRRLDEEWTDLGTRLHRTQRSVNDVVAY